MDLTARLARFAAGSPRPLLVPGPGGTAARLAVEADLARRGWVAASSPAEADLLVAAGPVGQDLARVLDEVWHGMPAPRARVHVRRAEQASAALEEGAAQLGDATGQRAAATAPPDRQSRDAGRSDQHGAGPDGGHGRADGGGHDMPAGLPMAERGEDRDGLKLDRLHVALGPALPDWPAGLVVRVTLQGDVVQEAEARTLPETPPPGAGGAERLPFWDEPWLRAAAGEPVTRGHAARRLAAARLDSTGRLLAVAGWSAAAGEARAIRDALLALAVVEAVESRLARLARRIARSRTLRWLISGVQVDGGDDVYRRLLGWLAEASRAVEQAGSTARLDPAEGTGPRGPLDRGQPPSAALLEVLPGLLRGHDLAAARLVVAALDPDVDELAVAREAVARG